MLFSQRRPHGIYYIQYLAYKNRKIFSSCHFSAFPRIIFIVFHRVSLFVCHCCCHCLHCLFANLFMCMYMPFIHVQSHPHSHINSCFFFFVFLTCTSQFVCLEFYYTEKVFSFISFLVCRFVWLNNESEGGVFRHYLIFNMLCLGKWKNYAY